MNLPILGSRVAAKADSVHVQVAPAPIVAPADIPPFSLDTLLLECVLELEYGATEQYYTDLTELNVASVPVHLGNLSNFQFV